MWVKVVWSFPEPNQIVLVLNQTKLQQFHNVVTVQEFISKSYLQSECIEPFSCKIEERGVGRASQVEA